jgi:hypothetical protein
VATTHLKVGAEKLASMTDGELLRYWNETIEANEFHRSSLSYTATEVPAGKPQLEFFEEGNQWVPRGHVLRCELLSDAAIEPDLNEPFISIDGRDFTLGQFMRIVSSFGGWGMRIEFVPNDELYTRPNLTVRDPLGGSETEPSEKNGEPSARAKHYRSRKTACGYLVSSPTGVVPLDARQ